jgi:hypothetical protein
MTSRITLNRKEVAAILPGLQMMAGALDSARLGHFPRLDPRVQFATSAVPSVFAQAEFSEVMAGHVVTAKERLASVGPSRKILLNVFEFEAAAYALRFGLREKLVPQEARAKALTLAGKLEKYRKRAKRATIRRIGQADYKGQSESWSRFVLYMKSILCCRPVFLKSKALPLMHRNGRDKLFEYAKAVAPAVPPARLKELVVLAKRELLRYRHPVTLGMLVSDEKLGRRFMAKFILKREDPHVLAKEFQSLDIIQSDRGEKLKAALVLDDFDEPAEKVTVIKPSAELRPDTAKPPIPIVDGSFEASAALPAPSTGPGPVPSVKELALLYTQWLARQFDPGDWDSITKQTQLEIWRPYHEPKRATASYTAVSNDPELRPEYLGSDAFEANNVYATWGATWLAAKNPNPNTAARAAAEGLRLADEWERMNYGTEKNRLSAIYLRS